MGFGSRLKKLFGSGKKEEGEVDDEINNEPIEITDEKLDKNKEGVSDEPTQPNNFKYLDDLIHSGVKEIILESNVILDDEEELNYKDGIKLDVADLVIDGNGYTIDACGKTRIFECIEKNIKIKNITLKNGYAYEGSAIYNRGDLTINESILKENTAEHVGGSVYNGNELTITESTFNDNYAHSWGGAIYNWGYLIISESTLDNNTAGGGGAIYNKLKIDITESTFAGNTANSGGAINNRHILKISESTLTDNTAQIEGGAIYNYGGVIDNNELIITKSKLNNNTSPCGGAIYNSKNLKVFNSEFYNNSSLNSIIQNIDRLQIYNSFFKNNKTDKIILTEGDASNFSILGGGFKDNEVVESIIFNNGKFCTIERSIFENNLLNFSSQNIINQSNLTLINPKISDDGETILNNGHLLIKKSSQTLLSNIHGNGNVEVDIKIIPKGENFDFGYFDKKIHNGNTKEINLNHDICLENYEHDFYEGGIELDIDNLIINGNGHTIDGKDKSRIFIITGNNITLKNLVIKNGHTHKSYDNLFNNNSGAIKINHNRKLITIKNCKFINNTSEENGGAILNGGELTIVESILTDNIAGENGGAILNGGELTIVESILTDNIARKWGGGAISNKGVLTILRSILNENISEENGGGAIRNNGELTIVESTFNNNVSLNMWGGGAISNGGKLTIVESTFTDNMAPWVGGAISNSGGLKITESIFNNNTVKENGGAISNGGGLKITESIFNNNTARENGGAVFNSGRLEIMESIFNNNTARENGGAISLRKESEYESNNCTFKDNTPDDVYEEKD